MKFPIKAWKWQQDTSGTWLCLKAELQAVQDVLSRLDPEKQYHAEVTQHREKRSPNANSYYWVLIPRLAEKLMISKPAAHNLMLRRYGQLETFGDQAVYLVIPETEEAQKDAMESETYHIKPTSQVRGGNDGRLYRTYLMLKGSHDYDTREMSVLIDGIVSECKALGIETLSPEELARMEGYLEQADKGA